MRVVVQRVSEASVEVMQETVGAIGTGLLLLLGIEDADMEADVEWLCKKLTNLRIFNDDENLMNWSIKDIGGSFLVVSQFTLHASTKKGNRPSFIRAAKPDTAIPLYEKFVQFLRISSGQPVETGTFGAEMKVRLLNDGPVTIVIDTKSRE